MEASSAPTPHPFPSRLRGWASLGELPARLGIPLWDIVRALQRAKLADATGRPTPGAQATETARWMEQFRQYHWRTEDVAQLVKAHENQVKEKQAHGHTGGYVSMKQLGEVFGRSAVAVGHELRKGGWRNDQGSPTVAAMSSGLAQLRVTRHGRIQAYWHGIRTQGILERAGWKRAHPQPGTGRSKPAFGRPARLGKEPSCPRA